jgi:hypothetical protein
LSLLRAGSAAIAAEINVVSTPGPMPDVMGRAVPMLERASGHKVTKAKDPETAKALAKFLSSEAAVSVMQRKGMDPG